MIIQRFEAQVAKTPSAYALKTADHSMTYDQLNCTANRIARLVSASLSQPHKGQRVCILFDHGPGMVAALLGVIKAGMVYVPLSPDYPEQRLHYMVSHSQASLILADSGNFGKALELASALGIPALEDRGENLPCDRENPVGELQVSQVKNLLYILYTSGSTGKPKGVMQTPENVLHFIDRYRERLNITAKDRLTLLSSFSHDAAVMDIYTALLTGATLYPLDMRKYTGNPLLQQWLLEEGITVWHSVPTLYRFFVNQLTGVPSLPALRYIVLGGERVLKNDIDSFRNYFPEAVLYNLYGQTESTYNAGAYITASENIENITLGEPVPGVSLFVVDEDDRAVDPFVVGEIIVAGPHLSTGYWRNEDMTSVFVQDEELGSLYYTGDLGRLLPDGKIEFMGRKDSMVKLRGFRIELGEVESRLSAHPQVRQVVALVKEVLQDDFRICAYIESLSPGEAGRPGTADLKNFLAETLPDYMMPGSYIFLDALPLTGSGKVDRKALPEPHAGAAQPVVPPETREQEQLVEIWSQVLPVTIEEIGIDSDFFELGGHSLRATTMLSRIHRLFQVRIPVAEIFRTSTIRGLAEYIKSADQERFAAIEPAPPGDYYAISPLQRRLYVLHEVGKTGTAYNMKNIMQVEGPLDMVRLEDAFKQLIVRHENLRTSFRFEEDDLVQVIWDKVDFKLEIYDSSHGEPEEIFEQFIRPFDLAVPPLIRAGVIVRPGQNSLLMRDTHHIISDGTSQTIFIEDLLALYSGKILPAPGIQYKDFCQWQSERRSQMEKQAAYWTGLFKDGGPVQDDFIDFPRPKVQEFAGDLLRMEFDSDLTAAIYRFNTGHSLTLFMFLLTVYNVLLFKYTGWEDIVVGVPLAGRNHPDTEKVMGLFINVLAIRNYPAKDLTFSQFLDQVKENTTLAYENGDYPFGDLLDMLGKTNEISRNPIYDVELVVQNMDMPDFTTPEISLSTYRNNTDVSQVDATLYVTEMAGRISFRLVYNTGLFKKATMERFLGHFKDIVSKVIGHKDIELRDIVISHDLITARTDAYDEIAGDLDF